MKKKHGFTLIELLVVISIIALLISIIMPALNKARESAKRAWCLNSIRSLTVAWMMYADDHDGKLCQASSWLPYGWIQKCPAPYERVPIEAPIDIQLQALEEGRLYPYMDTPEVFRCPVSKQTEMRTYSCSWAMGSSDGLLPFSVTKMSDINRASERIVFLDDYGQNWDGQWAVYYDQPKWWNPIPARHGTGTVVSYADGHSDWIQWIDERTIAWSKLDWQQAENQTHSGATDIQPENADLKKIQREIYGKLYY